jgi:hypothetical protein
MSSMEDKRFYADSMTKNAPYRSRWRSKGLTIFSFLLIIKLVIATPFLVWMRSEKACVWSNLRISNKLGSVTALKQ